MTTVKEVLVNCKNSSHAQLSFILDKSLSGVVTLCDRVVTRYLCLSLRSAGPAKLSKIHDSVLFTSYRLNSVGSE